MSDLETSIIQTEGNNETEKFAAELGSRLRGGEIIELIGDVGAGKTTFVRGFAKGAGSKSRVSSPTFTVSNVYNAEKFDIHHYDFYRLDDFKIIETELSEVTQDDRNVAILEWAQPVQESIPMQHVTIKIAVTGENGRLLTISIPKPYLYLKDAL